MENLVKPVTSAFFLVCHNRWHTEAILEGKVKMPFFFGGGGGGFIAMVTIQVSVTNNYDNPMYHAYSIPRYMYMYYNTMLFPFLCELYISR